MPTVSSFLFCLLICFSMHACNACYGFNNNMNLHETSIPSEMIPPISKELGDQELEEKVVKILESSHGATTINKLMNLQALLKEEQGMKKASSGNELIVYSLENLQQTAKMEGSKRQQRSMLGSAPNDTEEAVESNENDIVEDVVVMDYAQPHRKPPIHNENP